MDETLLSRVEDAGLNAAAPPQQRWVDGWQLRFSPGKAKRARCINALAEGRLPLAEKLALCARVYADAGLPLVVRLTPFTRPATLDAALAALGMQVLDDTRVLVCTQIGPGGEENAPPAGTRWSALDGADFAQAVGTLRGSPAEQRAAHAQRLALSPVPYFGIALCSEVDGAVLACGQMAIEADMVGLYDVFTHPDQRGAGLATWVCRRLLSMAAAQAARTAYLQVESDNVAALRVYRRLGFHEGYSYHYRHWHEPLRSPDKLL